jgi:hypothetical protein
MWWKKIFPVEKKASTVRAADEKTAKRPNTLHYYEADGALRAYANRAMVLGFISAATALLAVAFAAYVRLQPPTVIRVDGDGNATILGHKPVVTNVSLAQGADATPNEFDKKAFMRLFLDRYLNFSSETVNRNWADALNMMSANLRRATLDAIQKDNTVGRVQDEQITSVFHLRSIEASKDDPLSFLAYGTKEVHHVTDHHEALTKMVGKYHIRLITEGRTEQNPSGLLIADYGEELIEGEKRDAVAQDAAFATSK